MSRKKRRGRGGTRKTKVREQQSPKAVRLKRDDAVWLADQSRCIVSHAAEALGYELRVTQSKCKNKLVPHWHFHPEEGGPTVLQYWPSRGTWYDPRGPRGKVPDPLEITEVLEKVKAGETC